LNRFRFELFAWGRYDAARRLLYCCSDEEAKAEAERLELGDWLGSAI
jgi:hypothetical protein